MEISGTLPKFSLYLQVLSFLNETILCFKEVSITIVLFKMIILFSTKCKSLLSERNPNSFLIYEIAKYARIRFFQK